MFMEILCWRVPASFEAKSKIVILNNNILTTILSGGQHTESVALTLILYRYYWYAINKQKLKMQFDADGEYVCYIVFHATSRSFQKVSRMQDHERVQHTQSLEWAMPIKGLSLFIKMFWNFLFSKRTTNYLNRSTLGGQSLSTVLRLLTAQSLCFKR